MAATFFHRGDHAVVFFPDPLTWEASLNLVGILDTVVDTYFYTQVELIIASPGGNTNALRHVLDALADQIGRGLHLRNRVLSEAGSSAAILACLGDERVAGRTAQFLFHCARIHDVQAVTARDSAEIGAVLRRIDEGLISVLVDRALHDEVDAHQAARCAALRADRDTLIRLWCLTAPGRAGKPPPHKLRKLARALGRTVGDAIRAAHRETLTGVYSALFAIELPVSAQLAFTLHLIDRVGTLHSGLERPPEPVGLVVPEWRALYPPEGAVPRSALTRHALALGETGSGKTASAILPVVAALARATPERAGAALIIDPKRELLPVLQALAPKGLRHVRADAVAINIMAGPRWSLTPDIKAGRWLTASRRILCRAASFVRSSPARCLLDHEVTNQNAEFFDREGTSLVEALLALVLLLVASPRLANSLSWLARDTEQARSIPCSVMGADSDAAVDASSAWPESDSEPESELRQWVEELQRRARGDGTVRGPNALALVAWILDGVALGASSSPSNWPVARIARAVVGVLGDRANPEVRDLISRLTGYWPAMIGVSAQFAGVRATATTICSEFATPAIATTLYFGCEPGYEGNGLDFAEAVGRDGDAPLVLFQPARDGLD